MRGGTSQQLLLPRYEPLHEQPPGPHLSSPHRPLPCPALALLQQVQKMTPLDPEAVTPFVGEALRRLRAEVGWLFAVADGSSVLPRSGYCWTLRLLCPAQRPVPPVAMPPTVRHAMLRLLCRRSATRPPCWALWAPPSPWPPTLLRVSASLPPPSSAATASCFVANACCLLLDLFSDGSKRARQLARCGLMCCYLYCAGGMSKNYIQIKKLMFTQPEVRGGSSM